jgi:hypothetical protein
LIAKVAKNEEEGKMDDKDEAQEKLRAKNFRLGFYKHHKGPLYEATGVSIDEATLAPLVHYTSVSHGTRWTRTLENFTEEVDVGGEKKPRFRYCDGS